MKMTVHYAVMMQPPVDIDERRVRCMLKEFTGRWVYWLYFVLSCMR